MNEYFLYSGDLDPPLNYQIMEAGAPVDLTNKTVTFNARYAGSAVQFITGHAVTIVDAPNGKVRVVWASGETDQSGTVMGWFVTNPNSGPADPQSTPEFTFPIYSHSLAWCSADDIAACTGTSVTDDPVGLLNATQWATDVMQSVLARQFRGVTQDTIRPTRLGCQCWGAPSPGGGIPFQWGFWAAQGAALGWGYQDVPAPIGCGWMSEYALSYPVQGIVSVLVDGTALDPSQYRVDEERWLVRLPDANGQNPGWPVCQNMTLPSTDSGTWAVTFTWGEPPPRLAIDAAAQLACQLYLSSNGKPCTLPVGATKITRQGVTIERGLLADWTKGGSTGLALVDAAIRAYNPNQLTQEAQVWSPDLPKFGRHAGV